MSCRFPLHSHPHLHIFPHKFPLRNLPPQISCMIKAGKGRETQTYPIKPLSAAPRKARIAGIVVAVVVPDDGEAHRAVGHGVNLIGCEIGEGLSVGGGRREGHGGDDGDESEEGGEGEMHDVGGSEGFLVCKGRKVADKGWEFLRKVKESW